MVYSLYECENADLTVVFVKMFYNTLHNQMYFRHHECEDAYLKIVFQKSFYYILCKEMALNECEDAVLVYVC